MQPDNQDKQEQEDLPLVGEQTEPAIEAFTVESDEIEQQLRAEQQKAEEYLDLLRRTQADFINYRRRVTQEQAELRTAAQISLFKQLLPILDDFERAVDVTPENLAQDPWVQGLLLIARRLTALLDQLGVSQIGEPGEKFDPRLHEALTMEVRAGVPEGTILQVVRSGYALGERTIRPAQVVVAGTPAHVGDAPE